MHKIQKCINYTSKSEKSTFLEAKKVHANYKDNNCKELVIESSSKSPPDINHEHVRLMDEKEKK